MASSNGTLPAYAELRCASNFSFLAGASHPAELVERAARLGYQALAITDECSLAGVVRAHVAAKAAGLPLIIGAHLRLTHPDGSPALELTALATSRDGYGNLSELITLGRMRVGKGEYRLAPADLAHPDAPHRHLRGLPECLVILAPDYPANEDRLAAQLAWLAATFGDRAWVALTLHARAMDDLHRSCPRRLNFDPLCRLNFDQGSMPAAMR